MPALEDDDFTLLGVPQQFAQDPAVLQERWKQLQRQAHPDKFAAQGASAQRLAMQWSVRINEAYQRLKNPSERASYLCTLHGAPVNASSSTAMSLDFLQQQMQWRQALEEADQLETLNEIGSQCSISLGEQLSKIEQLLDNAHDYPAAAEQIRRLLFIQRLAQQVDDKREQLS